MSCANNDFLNIPNPSDANSNDRIKIEKEWSNLPRQKYSGDTLHGNLHGPGFYFIEEGDKLFYDGLFYANKLEGYAQVFYGDGSNFQGLFKNNIRFGPGVFTYPNGEQDVGLWSGSYLLRLGSLNQHNSIPRLATTSDGQMKLLKYKYLVPVCPKQVDRAYDILQRLGADESILRRSDELYNLETDNKHNVFFNKRLFDQQFYNNLDFSIEVALTDEEKQLLSNFQTKIQNPCRELTNENVERVRRLTEQLEIIKSKLKTVTEERIAIEKKVEYCRKCCYRDPVLEQEEEMHLEEVPEECDKTDVVSTGTAVTVATAVSVMTKASVKPKASHKQADSDWMSIEDLDTEGLFSSEHSLATIGTAHTIGSIVDSSTSTDDVMSCIEHYLLDVCGCDEATHVSDLYELERELEAVTRDGLFYKSIWDNLQEKLEKHQRQTRDAFKVNTKKVIVNDVLSWNNEPYCMRMLTQSFLHRNSEYLVNFKVSDIIAGNRAQFKDPGLQERNCTDFLVACSNGDIKAIHRHIQKNLINVNVCDAKGNSGVFFAAKNNHKEAIKALVNLGAKLNQQNDEGLLPLSMCILSILALQHNVENWEKSFLPEAVSSTERKDACNWYTNMSLLNVAESRGPFDMYISSTATIKSVRSKVIEVKPYLFDTSFVTWSPSKEERSKDNLAKRRMSFGPTSNTSTNAIKDTVKTLLRYGANTNASGSPLPPLFLALFTGEPSLVENILEADTDVNMTIDDDMTSLHVIASSKCKRANVAICDLLISYDCDPRLKTSPNHWWKQKMEILGKGVNPDTIEDLGKNPLHILCIRRDFPTDYCSYFYDMVMNFRDSYLDFNDRYLGHTPLSLAVLVGNKRLVQALMEQHVIDPHQTLDYGMGNVVTIYILKRYEDLIPPNAAEILKYLTESWVNVLRPIGDCENAIEFMEKEHNINKDKNLKDIPIKPENGICDLQKYLMKCIKVLGRDTIIKCIQLLAVENLYNIVEDDLAQHKCVSILSEYLTPTLALSNLQILFNHGKIKPERFNRDICLKLIDVVKTNFNDQIQKEWKRSKNISKTVPIDATDYSFMINMTDFTKMEMEKHKFTLSPPGLDNPSKYKVCFQCLRKGKKELLVCPRCQLVYFCSASCNKESLKLNLHPCKKEFYKSELAKVKSSYTLESENLADLYKRVQDNCEKRRLDKLRKNIELEKKQLEEEMKSDTYGTKLLRKTKMANAVLWRTPTTDSLMGSLQVVGKMETQDHCDSIANKTCSGSIRWDLTSSKDLLRRSYPERSHFTLLGSTTDQKKGEVECTCNECTGYEIETCNVTCKCPSSKKTRIKIKTQNPDVNLKKLRVLPPKYKEFIKLLTGYFPEVDVSSLLLPYACYSNGHLYYRFLGDDQRRTYSMM